MTLRELISVTLAWLDASLPNWFWMPVDTPETNERRYIPEPVEPKHVVIYQATGDEIISFGDHVDEMAFKHKQRIRAWFIAHGLWANRPDTRPRIWVEPYRDVRRPYGNTDTNRVQ